MTAARSPLDRIADSLEQLLELERAKRARRSSNRRGLPAEVADIDIERARRALAGVRGASTRKR